MPACRERLALAGVVTTVDAVNGLATLERAAGVRQAGGGRRPADPDQDRPAGSAEAMPLAARLAALNPSATVLQASFGDIDPARLFDMGLGASAAQRPRRAGVARPRCACARTRPAHAHQHDHGGGHAEDISCFAILRERADPRRHPHAAAGSAGRALRRRPPAPEGHRQRRREPRPARRHPRRAARLPSRPPGSTAGRPPTAAPASCSSGATFRGRGSRRCWRRWRPRWRRWPGAVSEDAGPARFGANGRNRRLGSQGFTQSPERPPALGPICWPNMPLTMHASSIPPRR